MKKAEALKIKETGHVVIRNAKTGEVLAESHNLMVTSGLSLIAASLIGSLAVGWCAIGTGTTAADVSQTALVTEVNRLQVTATSAVVNVMTAQTFFLAADSTYHIKEIGLFGTDSDGTSGSGTMFARALVDYDNSASPVDLIITFAVTLTIGA